MGFGLHLFFLFAFNICTIFWIEAGWPNGSFIVHPSQINTWQAVRFTKEARKNTKSNIFPI